MMIDDKMQMYCIVSSCIHIAYMWRSTLINFDSHKIGMIRAIFPWFPIILNPQRQLRFNHPTFSTPIWGFLPSDWCPVDGPWTWIDLGVWAADVTPSACGIPIKRIRQEAGRYANSIQRHNIVMWYSYEHTKYTVLFDHHHIHIYHMHAQLFMQSKYPHQIYGLPSCQSLSAPDLVWWYRLPSNDASARQSIHHRLDTSGSRFRTSKYLRISLIWWLTWFFRHFLRFRCAKPVPLLTHRSLATPRVRLVAKLPTWWRFSWKSQINLHSLCMPRSTVYPSFIDVWRCINHPMDCIKVMQHLKVLLSWLGCHTQHSNLSQLAKALVPEKVTLWFYRHDPLDVSLRVVVVAKEVILNRFYDLWWFFKKDYIELIWINGQNEYVTQKNHVQIEA